MREASRELNMRDKPRKRNIVWKRVVSAMAVIVVFCTVYALVLPAITLSEDPICGQQPHEHTEACYRSEIRVPCCPVLSHIHTEDCVGVLENPVCGFGERVLHTHSEICYDQMGTLICELPELQEHLHSESCQKTEQKLICTQQEAPGHTHSEECTAEAGLKCTLEETQGHTHSDGCYESRMEMICLEQEQPPHTHGVDCYEQNKEPNCGSDHEHTEHCYDQQLVCTIDENDGHTHIDSCYKLDSQLVCTEQEQKAHTHDETCYTEAKTCSLEECEGHTHGEQCYEVHISESCPLEQVADHLHSASCFDEAGKRTCGLISGVNHVHDETCFKVIRLDEPELICSLPEHIHVDACFLDANDLPPVRKEFYCEKGEHGHTDECCDADGNLICTIPEHTHDVSCKVPDYNPEADVETAEDWEKAFENLELTGRWPEDLLNVAVTQLNYTESKQNVILHEDGSVKGYSRYGAWYGAPYIDWSAAFVSFCVEYANISGLPQDSSCESYRNALDSMDLLREPMNYLPKPGDLVLLDVDTENDDVKANRMGIVSELMLNDSGELTTLKVLVGDAGDRVQYLTFDILSDRIVGYGETPVGETAILLCEQDHEHSEECYGYKLYYTDDTLHAQLLIQGIDELPGDVTLQVNRITAANDPVGYSSMIAALNNQMEQSPYYMGDASFYQMELLQRDQVYQLPQGAKTDVKVSFTDPVFTPEAMESAVKVETFQLTLDKMSNLLSGTVSAEMTQSNSGLGGSEQTGDAVDQPEDLPLDLYQVDQVSEDTYENASGGLTGVGFESEMVTTFAVVLSNTTKTGVFWERVFSMADIESGATYMIVSAEGNYALRGDNSNSYTAVTIQAQKGEESPDAAWHENPERNTKYYTIATKSDSSEVDKNHYWTIKTSGTKYTVQNQGTSRYLYPKSNSVTQTGSGNVSIAYETPENGFRFSGASSWRGTYFLRNVGDGAFSSSYSSDGQYNSSNVYYYSRDMLLFKLSDKTSLEIPMDLGDKKMSMVTDASTLMVGDRIIIAALDYDYALSTTQNTNDRGRASIGKSDSICTYSTDTQVITLGVGTTLNTFSFNVNGQYLGAGSSSSNQLKSVSTLDDNGSWSISIDSATGAATIKTNGSYTRNVMQYNSSTGIFSCYAADNPMQAICIYREVAEGAVKPDYGKFITVTNGLEDKTALTKDGVTVNGRYYSDPSTSDIETQFRQDSYEASKVIDGKVVTDKSVIYGQDDYGAFDHYDPNTFSVALSALGQEYEIPYEHQVRTPVDVVFVLDVSGSMSSNGDSTGTSSGQKANRIIWLRQAVNASMKQIMEDHEANRVGIAIYSGGAWELLPLDRYTADNDEYLINSRFDFTHSPTGVSFDINHLFGSSSLKNEAGVSFANAGSDAVQGIGTYTQAGIAMGNEIFEAIGDDTTYTTTVGEGEYQRTYTVTRQPVFILLSDGEPTYSTNIYNDVLNGPHYGNGASNASINGKGIHGYYTVLSANYYKRAVSIQYQKQAKFYSIGMGIQETTDIPDVTNYQTGDNYKRAVLNPDPQIIKGLTTTIAKENTTDQLKAMLRNEYEYQTVEVSAAWPEVWYGVPHVQEPVLQPNPYTDDYDYADGAYFGTLPAEELEKVFSDIYESSKEYRTYGFVLYKNSSVDILDRIGKGMEIKGTPVLRYAGVNHTDPNITVDGNVTTYVYEGIYTDPYIPDRDADLSHISVTVTTNADGTQTVEMFIMDQALPTYTPELIGREYYYEQLPVRLIYQVGLTEEAEKAILNLNKTGGELVYYTNQWQDENGNEDQDRISTSILLPSTANPFYYHIDGSEAPYKPHHSLKTDDTTHTVDYHVDCHREVEQRDGETLVKVIHKQGNNGKLVFNAVNIPVEKVWGGGINAEIMNPIQADIYKITETVDESGKIIRNAESVTSLTLSSENGWKATAKGLPKPDGTWYYAVSEAVPSGYIEAYNKQIIQITTDGEHFFDAVVVRDDLVDIPVEKQWGSDIDPELQEPVEMMIYKVTETKRLVTSGEEDVLTLLRYAEPVTTVTLSAENGWKAVAEDLPAPRNNWYYVIAEVMSPGENADYPGQTVKITTDDISAEKLNLSDINFFQAMMVEAPGDLTTVTNNPAVQLPSTGGGGTQWYTLGGLLLMTAAVILWYSCNNKRRKEERFTS